MPSSIDRSAPADKASLPEVMTTPFTPASAEVCFTISSSSLIEVSSSTFIERPGVSHVASTMPSASVSTLKFLKAICCSRFVSVILRWPRGFARPSKDGFGELSILRGSGFALAPQDDAVASNSFDDGRGAHAAADAQRHQRGLFVGALEFVEH